MNAEVKNRLMLTVDVEAFPKRAEKDHVERLIWGHYPDGRGGIGEMMDIADKYGVKLVMFLDYVEQFLWGEKILDVAREIHARGHDLQLHSHPELLPESFWRERGLPRLKVAGDATDEQANALFEFLCESHVKATGTDPIAYRGGGYRYGAGTLRAMRAHGVRLNSSYNSAVENQPLRAGRLPQFKWNNGCVEIPISYASLTPMREKFYPLNFNQSNFSVIPMGTSLENFYREMGDAAIAVLVMHSWSFSKIQESGYYSSPLPEHIARFDKFLSDIVGKVQIIDSRTALGLFDDYKLPLEGVASVDNMAAGADAFTRTNCIERMRSPSAYYL